MSSPAGFRLAVFLGFGPGWFAPLPAEALAAEGDVVLLKDGSSQAGQVVELGGNSIELVVRGGSRRILKQDIEKVTFDRTRQLREVQGTDLVIKQSGHKIRGAVEVVDGGQKVQVTLPGGGKAVLARGDVLRIVKAGEAIEQDTTVYTRELEETMEAALARLREPAASAAGGTLEDPEAFLESCGVLAIDLVGQALKTAAPDSTETAALERILRLHRLKQVTPTIIEEAEGRVYQILSRGTVQEKCDLLVFLFPRFVDESVSIASLLARDGREEPIVRAWAVDFLRRMQKNRELLRVYKESSGQVQMACAIALGHNRILVGIPTLIEALEMDTEEVRGLAAKHLKDFTGQDFRFRPDGAPQARKESIERWRAWWREQEAALAELAEKVLRDENVSPPEREAATALWREASASIEARDYERAEKLLRRAAVVDPTFPRAQLGLALLLYAERGKPSEAVEVLQRLKSGRVPGLSGEERQWIELHLGNSLRLSGDLKGATEAYERCVALAPASVYGHLGLGDVRYAAAIAAEGLNAEERKKNLQAALDAYLSVLRHLEKIVEELTTLRFEDMPAGIELPFDRREYNRSVVELRRKHRRLRQETIFKTVTIRSLLGDKKESVVGLNAALEDLQAERTEETRDLEIKMRTYLGLLHEELGKPLPALKEYRRVLKDLDPKHPECLRGVERLRRHARHVDGESSN